MTTCLGNSCSFVSSCVSFKNVCVCVLLSLLVLRMGCEIRLYKFLVIDFCFTLCSVHAILATKTLEFKGLLQLQHTTWS